LCLAKVCPIEYSGRQRIRDRESRVSIVDDLDLASITDERIRRCLVFLVNLVEDQKHEISELRAENQRLHDEINRLKGERGKPTIKGNKPPSGKSTNYSSEPERRTPREWAKDKKTPTLVVSREEVLRIDPAILPADAEFKGYEDIIVQDLIFRSDTVRFRKEKFHSPGEHKTYLAPLPPGYAGQFGPGIRALSLVLAFGANVSEPKIRELFTEAGIQISDGEVSNLLIHGQEQFHAEKDAVVEAGLRSSPWQHLDQTSTRVNGQNQNCQILCNPLYTALFTTPSKDRLSVLDVLRNGRPRVFLLNDQAERWLDQAGLSRTIRQQVARLPHDQIWDEATLHAHLDQHVPTVGPQQRRWIADATAVAAYHAQDAYPIVRLLLCDDAPQFVGITEELALCWIHEGRHYKKLTPWVKELQETLAAFLTRFWDYYRDLQAYRVQPTRAERDRLAARFDEVFTPNLDYRSLDERIAKTRENKAHLLQVLAHPEILLHNNPAELGARGRVRKRDVSFGPRTTAGARAWDTFGTLAATARKLGVSFFAYVQDRINATNLIPRLDQVIQARAHDLNLGLSWNSS
jgi:Transposase IS66 family